MASQDCDTDQEQVARTAILGSLNCSSKQSSCKSRNEVLDELALELKDIQSDMHG